MNRISLSLDRRLWLVLALAMLPLFLLALREYQSEKDAQRLEVVQRAGLILAGAQIAQTEAIRQIEATLRIMAAANETQSLDSGACDQLAGRLLQSLPDLSNLGAADAAGRVICSGMPQKVAVSVGDRQWFADALANPGMTRGEFAIGRISGQPTVIFGQAVREADGRLRGLLFAANNTRWFDRFTHLAHLPAGWSTLLLTRDGTVLSRYPDPEAARLRPLPEESRAAFAAALAAGRSETQMAGINGVERLYTFAPPPFAGDQIYLAIGAPIADTFAPIRARFVQRLLWLVGITLVSILAARYLLREIVDRQLRQLHDQSERLRTALDHVPALVYLKDADGRYTYANRRTLTRLGVDEAGLLGRRDSELGQPAGTGHRAQESRVLAGETVSALREDGGRLLQETLSPLTADDGMAVRGLCGIAVDVTELRRADESLRTLSSAVEQSPESILFTDPAGNIEYVNDACIRSSGYSRAELLGRNPRLFASGKTRPQVYAQMWRTLQAGETWRGELCNRRKDGRDYIEMTTISPVRDDRGEVRHYVAVKWDITELRDNEAELASYRHDLERLVRQRTYELAVAKEQAESANRAKAAFLANMSHEIRTPMNAISSLHYLLLHSPLSADQAAKVRKASQAADRLHQIINDILDLAKIESGRLAVLRLPFSPVTILREVADLARHLGRDKPLSVQVDPDGLPPVVDGDAKHFRQILVNFVSNAVKFTASGEIAITARPAPNGAPGHYRISVRDSGIGIRSDHLPRLFRAFEQIEDSNTRRFGGSGLGLAIARQLAELMGGEVGVDSTPGSGSTFWVDLPLIASTTPLAEVPAADEAGDRYAGRVLVVDDEPVNREVCCEVLGLYGIEAVAVDSGAAALDYLRREPADAVLLDLQMPGMNGLETSRALHQALDPRCPPLIALTADQADHLRTDVIAAGMIDLLIKPLQGEDLLATLRPHLTRVDRKSPAATCAAPLPVVAHAEWRAALPGLAQLLITGNIEAQAEFARLQPAFAAYAPADSEAITQAVERFQFDLASEKIQSLMRSTAGAPPAAVPPNPEDSGRLP